MVVDYELRKGVTERRVCAGCLLGIDPQTAHLQRLNTGAYWHYRCAPDVWLAVGLTDFMGSRSLARDRL